MCPVISKLRQAVIGGGDELGDTHIFTANHQYKGREETKKSYVLDVQLQ